MVDIFKMHSIAGKTETSHDSFKIKPDSKPPMNRSETIISCLYNQLLGFYHLHLYLAIKRKSEKKQWFSIVWIEPSDPFPVWNARFSVKEKT